MIEHEITFHTSDIPVPTEKEKQAIRNMVENGTVIFIPHAISTGDRLVEEAQDIINDKR